MAASTQFAYRTLKGIGIVDAAPKYAPLPGFQRPEGSHRCCTYSPDGRYFAWASNESVNVADTTTGSILTTLPIPNVYELGFSPHGSYIITWERPSKDEAGDAVKNLKVWKTVEEGVAGGDKEVVGKFVQRSQTGWNLQYTADEKYCARTVTNEVQFYESGNLGTVWNKLRAEGVSDFALSPGNNNSIAVFIPERKVSVKEWSWYLRLLISLLGTTCCCQDLQCSSIHQRRIPEKFLQGRQSAIEVE